jgi:hypothetical protein
MSWDDVIIGSGKQYASARKVHRLEGDHDISENNSAYWAADCILGIGMTIYKSSEQGVCLTNMIENGKSTMEINEWLDLLAIRNIGYRELLEKISCALNDAKRKGAERKMTEIKIALGI